MMGGDSIYGPFNLIMDLENLPGLEGDERVEVLERIEAWLWKYPRCKQVKGIEEWLRRQGLSRAPAQETRVV